MSNPDFWGKQNKRNISNLSSAEFAHRMMKGKEEKCIHKHWNLFDNWKQWNILRNQNFLRKEIKFPDFVPTEYLNILTARCGLIPLGSLFAKSSVSAMLSIRWRYSATSVRIWTHLLRKQLLYLSVAMAWQRIFLCVCAVVIPKCCLQICYTNIR